VAARQADRHARGPVRELKRADAGRRARGAHPHRRQAPCLAAPCTRAHRAGSRHPAHQKRESGRARSALPWCTACRWRTPRRWPTPRRSIFTGIFPNSLRSWIRCCGAPGAFPVAGRWHFHRIALHRLGRPRQSARRAVRARLARNSRDFDYLAAALDAGMPRGLHGPSLAAAKANGWRTRRTTPSRSTRTTPRRCWRAPARRRRAAG